MASTNTPSVQWNVGDSAGRDIYGDAAAIPAPFVVSTATDAPTEAPEGFPLYLAVDDAYLWDGSAWQGPYSVAT